MKALIVASTVALGLACASSTGAAQDQTQPTNLPSFTVTAPVGQYETYTINLPAGYGVAAFVGNTHMQYVQAARAAERSETQRKLGMAPQSCVAVAIDNSVKSGVSQRIFLNNAAQTTVAIVDVYCKRIVPSGRARCQMYSRQVQANV